MNKQTATLAGGCFWCLEAVFKRLKGVEGVMSGYIGGTVEDPSYTQVCSGSTGHAEAVQIEFDAEVISFKDLLDVFFDLHDPTTLNRQGADIGTQYRSAIFYHNEDQKTQSEKYIEQLESSKKYSDPIVTQVVEATKFYKAENYHDDYYENNKDKSYCRIVISPKLDKLKKDFSAKLK